MREPAEWRSGFLRSGLFRFSVRQAVLPMLTVCALGLPAGVLQAAEPAPPLAIESAKASSGLLVDITRAGKRLVAIGERGHILFSEDAGRNWVQARVPSRQLLTGVFFVDDQRGWAVGHDAQILASDDGGANWKLQFEDVEREAPLLDVWFADHQHGFAVGAYGALLETRDGGERWLDVSERLDNPDGFHLNAIAALADGSLFIVGEAGSLFRSTDQGLTWESLKGPYEGTLFGVQGTAKPHTLLIYGLRGNLYRSTDLGNSWQKIPLLSESGPLEFGLSGSTLLKDGSLVIVGHGGSVLLSKDAGRSFSVLNRSDRVSLAGVAENSGGQLVLVGQGGVHLATATGDLPAQQ